eukprot:scaffold34656_cov178-Amphora_coffeaeformis.AAC.6
MSPTSHHMIMKSFGSILTTWLTFSGFVSGCLGFVVPSSTTVARRSHLLDATADRRMGELTSSEQKVFDLLQTLHDANHPFRIVVVGKGAILETTSVLGPALSVSQSPKTGKNLMTLASDDKSFEFHLQLADVSQIAILEKETPMKTMRIIRVLGAEGQSMCSLILADQSDSAIQWFHGLVGEYGATIDLA